MDIPESIILPFQERDEHFIVRGGFAEDESQGYGVEGIERVVFIGFAEEGSGGKIPPGRNLLLTMKNKMGIYHTDVDTHGRVVDATDLWEWWRERRG
jgi:hypothetical protein